MIEDTWLSPGESRTHFSFKYDQLVMYIRCRLAPRKFQLDIAPEDSSNVSIYQS